MQTIHAESSFVWFQVKERGCVHDKYLRRRTRITKCERTKPLALLAKGGNCNPKVTTEVFMKP